MPVIEDLRQKILDYIEEHPSAMTSQIARTLDVPEVEILRAQEGQSCWELRAKEFQDIVREFEHMGKSHVFCTNKYAVLEAFGEFGGFSVTGPFFNVQTESIDMHIRYEGIDSIFCLEKLGHFDRKPTYSVQFYSPEGDAVFKVFLSRPGPEEDYEQRQLDGYQKIKSNYRKNP